MYEQPKRGRTQHQSTDDEGEHLYTTIQRSTALLHDHSPQYPVFGIAALFSGAALLVSIVLNISLVLTLTLLALVVVLTALVKWNHTPLLQRPVVKKQFTTGIIAGFLATVAYDLTRMLLTWLGALSFYPFDTFTIFGKLIIGVTAPPVATLLVGSSYHLLNGIAFGIGYCFLFGGRRWYQGLIWAFALEAAMLAVYPGWLNLWAVLEEFLAVSVVGHMAYGLVLGFVCQKRLSTSSLTSNM